VIIDNQRNGPAGPAIFCGCARAEAAEILLKEASRFAPEGCRTVGEDARRSRAGKGDSVQSDRGQGLGQVAAPSLLRAAGSDCAPRARWGRVKRVNMIQAAINKPRPAAAQRRATSGDNPAAVLEKEGAEPVQRCSCVFVATPANSRHSGSRYRSTGRVRGSKVRGLCRRSADGRSRGEHGGQARIRA